MENAALVCVMDRNGDDLNIAGGPQRRQRLLAHKLRQVLALLPGAAGGNGAPHSEHRLASGIGLFILALESVL